MSSINGFSYGQLIISSAGDTPVTQTINLPLCGRSGGLEEITILRQVRHEVTGLDIDNPAISQLQGALGFDLAWNFHYEEWISGSDLYNKFYPILKAWKLGYTMTLIPRVDVPSRSFTVILTNENLTMRLNKATQKNKYHKGVLFSFQTKEMQSDVNWLPTPQETDPVVIVAINEFNIS